MSYKLIYERTIPENVAQIVNEQIDRAIAELSDPSLEVMVAIHQARKRIKKIRAVLRLVRNDLGSIYRYENLLYRDMGRRLSEIRDAQAAVETFDKLKQRYPSHFVHGAFKNAENELRKGCQLFLNNKFFLEKLIREVVELLQSSRKRMKAWPQITDQFSALDVGYRKTYRRGRRLFNTALVKASSENLHELRKAVKYHWCHGRLFCEIQSKRMNRYTASVKRMCDLLGEYHDMVLLRSMLLKHPERYGSYHEIRELLALIDRRETELWQQAEPLGALIFLEKPGFVEKRMLEKWEQWRLKQSHRAHNLETMQVESSDIKKTIVSDDVNEIQETVATYQTDQSASVQPDSYDAHMK